MAEDTQRTETKDKILAQIQALDEAGEKGVVKTRSRRAKVKPEYVGHTLAIFDGHAYQKVRIVQEHVGKQMQQLLAAKPGTSAQLRYVSIPPRKMRAVADLIKGKPVEDAMNILNFSPRIAAHHMAKTVKSAAANVLSQGGTAHIRPENLYIKSVVVDGAPIAKRIRFQSMGRVFRIHKRHCHLTVELGERPETIVAAETPGAKQAEAKSAPKRKTTRKATTKKKATSKAKSTTKKSAKTKTAATKNTAARKKTSKKKDTAEADKE